MKIHRKKLGSVRSTGAIRLRGAWAFLACAVVSLPACSPANGVTTEEPRTTETTGAVRGVVTDLAGGRLAYVTVRVTVAGHVIETQTDGRGAFVLGEVAPGSYEVTVSDERHGFSGTYALAVRANHTNDITLRADSQRALVTAGDPDAFRGAQIWDDLTYATHIEGAPHVSDSTLCVSCHGYQGERRYAPGRTPVVDVMSGRSERQLAAIVLDHTFGTETRRLGEIIDARAEPQRIAADVAAFLTRLLRNIPIAGGDTTRGRETFFSICVRCHGADGRAININAGSPGAPAEFLGEAGEEPDEFAHRIQYGHPQPAADQVRLHGVTMPAFRALPAGAVRDLVAFLATLPEY